MSDRKYTIKEIEELLELAEEYKHLEKMNRLIKVPVPLESMVYRVVPDCKRCTAVEDIENCKVKLHNKCVKKVMPCVFTVDLIPQFGKTVFGTESEAVVASVHK